MHMRLSGIRLLLLLVAFTLAVAGFFPITSTAAVAGPCGDMKCPGGPNFCDYLPDGRECNCGTDNCQTETQ